MRIVLTLILSTLFFVSTYAAGGADLPSAPDIDYHPLRTDVTTGGATADDVFVACPAGQYDALEPSTTAGEWKNFDESTDKYKKNCVACSRATFLVEYKKIITVGKWQKDQCCRASENVVCQEMLRAYKAGCTETGESTHDGTNAGANPTGYGKFAECTA
tara:strand:+ start:568 stop:1047 length:480 start_codon:yes stop_codon:yes gene_type:complete